MNQTGKSAQRSYRGFIVIVLLITFCFVTGCAGKHIRNTSNLVEYLYSDDQTVIVNPSMPAFSSPLKLGICFIPNMSSAKEGDLPFQSYLMLSEKEKADWSTKLAEPFKKQDFIHSINIIPSQYLTENGGFAELEKIAVLHNIDTIALISFDQVQHSDQGMLAVTYWTIFGAYIFKGEKNDTSTMVETTVYHIPSKKMLMRATGSSRIKASATMMNLSEQLRENSSAGFDEAFGECTQNLEQQLIIFKQKCDQQKSTADNR